MTAEQKNYAPARLCHLGMENEETNKKTRARIKGPIDGHAGNTEISMMLAVNSKLVSKPDIKKHPKQNYNHDWKSHYIIDSSSHGVADKHPEWVISKKMGEEFIDLHAKLLIREIRKIDKANS